MFFMDRRGLDTGWEVRLNGSETDILPSSGKKKEKNKPILLSFQVIER